MQICSVCNLANPQTILSFIMRLRLGGKGYQPDPENPVLLHAKPLGEFVDSIMKLQSVAEEEPDLRWVFHFVPIFRFFVLLFSCFIFISSPSSWSGDSWICGVEAQSTCTLLCSVKVIFLHFFPLQCFYLCSIIILSFCFLPIPRFKYIYLVCCIKMMIN